MLGAPAWPLSSTFGLVSNDKEGVGVGVEGFASFFVSDGLAKDVKGFLVVAGGCEVKGDGLNGCAGAADKFEEFVSNGEAVLDYTLATSEGLGSAECRSIKEYGAGRDTMRCRNRFSNPWT